MKETNFPGEVSFEDAKATQQLKDILETKAKEKVKLENFSGLNILSKSKFYYSTTGELREHIATYKGYAILLREDNMIEDIDGEVSNAYPIIVTLSDLKKLKKINGNVVRKLQPKTIHEYEKMAVIQGVVTKIDEGI
jgi:hypothetical protein